MAKGDIIIMKRSELRRLHVIKKVLEGVMTQKEASKIIEVGKRQTIRIVKRVKQEGEKGIIHQSRGKPSNRAYSDERKKQVIKLYREKYWDFGPTLASEKLLEIDKIKLSDETLRKWLIESEDWQKRKKVKKHRKWRERKHYIGEMLQGDGSIHDWFEDRGERSVLMGYIDDADSKVFARFYEYEGTIPVMDLTKRYVKKYGIPSSLYMDKHATYKSTAKQTIEQELNGEVPMSQFERAAKEMGIKCVHAHSPQAKGRIERLFKTFQDRVIKEMRLAGIKDIKGANEFLKIYLKKYNKRFCVEPISKVDLHRALPEDIELDRILCKKTNRAVRNDFTVAHEKKLYQIISYTDAKKVCVEERISGRMIIRYKEEELTYKKIENRPKRTEEAKKETKRKQFGHIPSRNHPWRGRKKSYPQIESYQQRKKKEAKKKEKLLLLVH